ncbi:type VI secretion system contractile sheath small subunit [Thiomonas sp.]|uniref:type VI secretion system contractile sheath small subunit n=1 Tax=Thiomonas sp. TaxID=2047785 RepID=UPI002617F93E|nr:type VI secretion system contractile sheath small subunit [Thiomonas sp.]
MPSQSSVAPKERVNIVYRPATEGAQAEVELPLKLLVLGDYTLRDDDTPLEEIEPVAVDKDNFDDVLAGQAPRLELQVPDMLSRQRGCTLALDLRFTRLDDFSPDALVAQVPQLRALLELRDALKALKGPLSNIPAFRRKLQQIAAEPELRRRLGAELRQAADEANDPGDADAAANPAESDSAKAQGGGTETPEAR